MALVRVLIGRRGLNLAAVLGAVHRHIVRCNGVESLVSLPLCLKIR
jgi:hypothetical protein